MLFPAADGNRDVDKVLLVFNDDGCFSALVLGVDVDDKFVY